MSELKNCKFCTSMFWDRQFQHGYCKEKGFIEVDLGWAANHCDMYKIDTVLNPAKMTVQVKCSECKNLFIGSKESMCRKTYVILTNTTTKRICVRYTPKKTSGYVEMNWATHGNLHGIDKPMGYVETGYLVRDGYPTRSYINGPHAVNEINKHTKENKFIPIEDLPYAVMSVGGSSRRNEGEIKMNENFERRIKEKQEKINKIVERRKEYIENWFKKFKELDYNVLSEYVLNYSSLKEQFIRYVTKNIEKKIRKTIKTALRRTLIYRNDHSVMYGKRGHRINAHVLSGEEWVFVKKILAVVSKYATMYVNELLKIKYSKLTSKYDGLLFDNERVICESCGTENELVALYCNTCGKKV